MELLGDNLEAGTVVVGGIYNVKMSITGLLQPKVVFAIGFVLPLGIASYQNKVPFLDERFILLLKTLKTRRIPVHPSYSLFDLRSYKSVVFGQ